jgi:TolB-like protein/DNA-binding winged helix-turn-helix (wHTH) protein/Flp pilus assembly protein TadD
MNEQKKYSYTFGPFRLDVAERLLLRDGESLTLPPKAFETLLALVENSGHLLTKPDLMKRLWPDTFVEEANLANNVSLLRRVLDDDRQVCKYIETVPKLGYRFVADVEVLTEGTDVDPFAFTPAEFIAEEKHEPATGFPVSHWTRRRWFPALIVCVLLAVAAGYYFFRWRSVESRAVTSTPAMRSLAVLPFKPLIEANRDEVLEFGITDTLITRMSNIRQINVRPIGAVRRYSELEHDPIAAGREQQVDAVLDGNIQKAGDKIRVSVRLVRVADEVTLWATQFDEQYTDIFAVQDAISQRVAEVLIVKLSGKEKEALAKHYTENVEAYQLYTRGRYFWSKFTEEGLMKSIECFDQALEKDPNYVLAYYGLASAYIVLGVNYRPPRDVMPKAKAYVVKALELDKQLADAYGAQGGIKYFYEWDWAGAESEFKRAIELGPSDAASAHQLYGYYLWAMGRLQEATTEMKRAQELDPLSLVINEDVGVAHYYARNYDQAIEQQKKTLDLDSNYFFAHQRLGQAYEQKGMFKEAVDELNMARTKSGNWPGAVAELGCAYGLAGQKRKARTLLNELQERATREYIDPYLIALIHTSLGERDAAFEWLAKAYEVRSPWMAWLKVEPKFDPLRSDPRFETLLQQLGLRP